MKSRRKLLLTLTVLFIGIVLSACTDKEIKELNGEWEGYDGSDKIIMKIKNGNVKIINYGEHESREEAERFPMEAKIYKEGNMMKLLNEEGDGANFHLTNDNLVFEGGVFYRVK
ncbi:hypothetical protein AACG95_001596 [Staphylococcus pseudintermedius]